MLAELAAAVLELWALTFVLAVVVGAAGARRWLLALWWPPRTLAGKFLVAAALWLVAGGPPRPLGVAVLAALWR